MSIHNRLQLPAVQAECSGAPDQYRKPADCDSFAPRAPAGCQIMFQMQNIILKHILVQMQVSGMIYLTIQQYQDLYVSLIKYLLLNYLKK